MNICNPDGFLFWIKGHHQENRFRGDSPAEREEKKSGEVYQWSSRSKELEKAWHLSSGEDKNLKEIVMSIFRKRKQNLIDYITACSNSPTSSTPRNRPDNDPGPHNKLKSKAGRKKKSHKAKRKSHKKKRKSPKNKRSRK